MTNREILSQMIIHVPLNTHADPKNIAIIGDFAKQESIDYYELDNTASSENLDIAILDHFSNYDSVKAKLNDNSILSVATGDIYQNSKTIKEIISSLKDDFKIIMPSIFKDNLSFLLCSKKYHPTADIILQRAEMLPRQKFYNADFHKASFVYNNLIEDLYKGYIFR